MWSPGINQAPQHSHGGTISTLGLSVAPLTAVWGPGTGTGLYIAGSKFHIVPTLFNSCKEHVFLNIQTSTCWNKLIQSMMLLLSKMERSRCHVTKQDLVNSIWLETLPAVFSQHRISIRKGKSRFVLFTWLEHEKSNLDTSVPAATRDSHRVRNCIV